jgi:hypothetical protein
VNECFEHKSILLQRQNVCRQSLLEACELDPAWSVESGTRATTVGEARLPLTDLIRASQLDIEQSNWYGTKEQTKQYKDAVKGSEYCRSRAETVEERIRSTSPPTYPKSNPNSLDSRQRLRQQTVTNLFTVVDDLNLGPVRPPTVCPLSHTTPATASLIRKKYRTLALATTTTSSYSSDKTRSVSRDSSRGGKESACTSTPEISLALSSSSESDPVEPYRC